MADKKISQMPPAATSGGTDYIPIVQGGVNKRSNPNILGVNYSSVELTTIAVGGLPAGSNITNQNVAAIIKQMTSPYIDPTFTSFAISGVTTQEVGSKLSGVQTFTWAISTVGNVQPNSINIIDATNALTLITGHSVTSPATYDFSLYTSGGLEYDTPASNTWQIQGTNTNSISFNRNYTANWYWLLHYGTSINTSLTGAQILALTGSLLTSTTARTYSYAAGGYKYLCINTTLPQPTTFKDQSTNLDVPFEAPVIVSVTNGFGIVSNYNVYRSTNILGAAINIIVA